jgi:hypothetical protein
MCLVSTVSVQRNSVKHIGSHLLHFVNQASMDHAQIKAIRGWPFLLSTHVLSDFVLIELENSVRAHSDKQFQRLQKMTRMSPRALLHDPNLKSEFEDLCRSVLSWETTWDAIDSSYQQIYPRRMPAFEAARVFVDRCQAQFEDTGTEFEVSVATDTQRLASSRAEFASVTSQSLVGAMNHGLKEPKKLLFFKGGQYFATVNGEGYNQSQLLLMDVLPSADTIARKAGILLLAAPPGVNYVDIRNGVPSRSHLERERWKEVTIDVSRDRTISHRGMMGKREQYSLKREILSSRNDSCCSSRPHFDSTFETRSRCRHWVIDYKRSNGQHNHRKMCGRV